MRGIKYILFTLALIMSASVWGQYNPTNPAEPGAPVTTYTLTLAADPSGGGSFNLNATTSYQAGATVNLRAYAATNFTFTGWTDEEGTPLSASANFSYTMPDHNVKLIAHYIYTPGSPGEPNEPDIPAKPVYAPIYLTASPSGSGTFNIGSGNSYEVGSKVSVRATPASNFRFVNWTQDGEVIATSATFSYIILEGAQANRLTANFSYEPGSPGEPSEPQPKKIYHRVFLMSDPAAGGYFNVTSGNEYEEGTAQTFRAYNNQWYSFQHWTRDGEVVSTNSSITITIPDDDVTLTAHYTYYYNPGSPAEPDQPTGKRLALYGMTENGMPGQTITYPIYLENTEAMPGVTVVMRFPEGFTVHADNVVLAERAAGHSISVEALGDNSYRFDVTGTLDLTGDNGKVFEVPVTISDEARTDSAYQVALSLGARINTDGSKDMIGMRSGHIFVERVKEDGLYASFTYDKLQNRIKFNNYSSDKALTFVWDFGDGTFSTERSPLHVYAEAGYYDVTLTAKGSIGSEEAKMTILINDESTWRVDGTFFLDPATQGVRYFATADDLFTFMAAHPIGSNLGVNVKAAQTFDYSLTEETVARLTTIQRQLADGGYTLTLLSSNTAEPAPTMCFGTEGAAIDADVVSLFMALGRQLKCDDVRLQLWGLGFNPSKTGDVEQGQTLLSGTQTTEVDFTPISTDLTFSWTATADVETATGYQQEGTGNIPAMTITTGSATDAHITYHIVASRGSETFCELTHVITLRPSLEGSFTTMMPADGSQLETTTVTLTWNSITNAVYDVYLWNAANQRPATPMAEGISELSYTSRNFCQNLKTYKWQVVARNAAQQIVSDTLHFSIHMLPDLHITSLRVQDAEAASTGYDLEAGKPVIVQWTVRNDGDGTTGSQSWQDRLWIVPDVYGGTNQTSCKLLATVNNVRSLSPGEQYTGQAEITIDEEMYGSYYLLVASDMSSVTNIDWTKVGGTIVNPYTPVVGGNAEEGTYAYLFATTSSQGNQLTEHGEDRSRSDNFFYRKVEIAMPAMSEEDWNQLKAIYAELGDGEGWTRKWNFDVERRTVLTLPGVSIRGGRVVSINLSDNGMTGTFPYCLLTMPALQSLNLSGNRLTGDLGEGMTAFASTTDHFALQSLNLSGNQLTGNIGVFAQPLTNLTTLYAQQNQLQEVVPMLATTVKNLNLGSQTIDKVIEVDFSNLLVDDIVSQLPTILTYDHQQQNYGKSLNLLCSGPQQWQLMMTLNGSSLTFPYVSEQNAYYGESGDTLAVEVVSAQRKPEGSTLQLKMAFAEGDANFNGTTDVTDLQAQINFAFEDYKTKPFNFTAANLWRDEVINVQDVVKMTDRLLSLSEPSTARANTTANGTGRADATTTANGTGQARTLASAAEATASATVSVRDGLLWIDATKPVAAFELTLRTANTASATDALRQSGFTCRTNSLGDVTRVVAYSLNGATLPAAPVAVCQVGQAQVVSAVLADAEAEPLRVYLIDGETTAINDRQRSEATNGSQLYDLQGRKAKAAPADPRFRKGIYILNGQKVVR